VSDEVYRRRIELRPSDRVVDAAMEDYLHHVGLRLHHDGVTITAVEVAPERLPWTTCPVGVAGAGALEGVALDDVADVDRWMGGRSAQCVHAVDLAVLAASAARRGTDRTYEVWVEPTGADTRRARLLVDGEVWATWGLDGVALVVDAAFEGLSLDRQGFSTWTSQHLDPDDAEKAFVLRRAIFIAVSRTMDMDAFTHPDESGGAVESCHTFRADIAAVSLRNRGTARATEADGAGAPLPPVVLRPAGRHPGGTPPGSSAGGQSA
jgi:hypothetical protein